MSLGNRQYVIREALGRGGFGTVYRAELKGESGFSKAIALKVLNPEVEHLDEVAQRFRDEARVLGLVRHRSIVHVDGLVRLTSSDGSARWAVVMELIEGCHIGVLLRQGPLPMRPATEIAGEVAAALHAAWHRKNTQGRPLHLLHRDIKPGNIQITAEGEVKVLDFGIARADFAQREAQTRSIIYGTKGYMAPERVALALSPEEGEDGPEGDIYSLGVVFHQMLTGKRFEGNPIHPENHAERVKKALNEAFQQLGEKSEVLVTLLGRMLAFDAALRPTARELMRACAAHRTDVGSESLLDWAERTIPAIREALPELSAGQMTGETLYEEQGAPPTVSGLTPHQAPEPPPQAAPPPPAKAPARTFPMWPFILVGVGLMLVVGIGGIAALQVALRSGVLTGEDEAPAQDEASQEGAATAEIVLETPKTEPAVVQEPEAEPDPEEAPVATPAPSSPPPERVVAKPAREPTSPPAEEPPTPVEEPMDEPEEEIPTAAPEPEEPSGGTIRVTGSATNVMFVSNSGKSHSPGTMPAGTYTIKADFGGGQVVAGSVTLLDGQQRRFSCVAEFTLCREN